MEDIASEQINQCLGIVFQQYRLKNNLTQEKLAELISKSSKSISQIETGRDGTSKRTDIELMNLLEIEPNILYKNFITNSILKERIELSDKISYLSIEQIRVLSKIVDAIQEL